MSCTYLFHVQVTDFESHLVDLELDEDEQEDQISDLDDSDVEPLLAALRNAIGTTLMDESFYSGEPIRLTFVDQATGGSDQPEMCRLVGKQIEDEVEAELGWRPKAWVQAMWWGY